MLRPTLIVPVLIALLSAGCVTGTYASPADEGTSTGPDEYVEEDDEGRYFYSDDAYDEDEAFLYEEPPLESEEPVDEATEAASLREGNEDERRAALDGHGNWVATEDYGEVWDPTGVQANWRPYTVGRWVYRPVGWTWISDYPWGWVTFHYGRWAYDAIYGWVWVPGNRWGPAWVAWTYSDAYIGWAPLPPYVAVGTRWVGTLPDPWWCFSRRRYFRRRRFRPRVLPARRNPSLVAVSRRAPTVLPRQRSTSTGPGVRPVRRRRNDAAGVAPRDGGRRGRATNGGSNRLRQPRPVPRQDRPNVRSPGSSPWRRLGSPGQGGGRGRRIERAPRTRVRGRDGRRSSREVRRSDRTAFRREVDRADRREARRLNRREVRRADRGEARRLNRREVDRADRREARRLNRREVRRADRREARRLNRREVRRADQGEARRLNRREVRRSDRREVRGSQRREVRRSNRREVRRSDRRAARREVRRSDRRLARREVRRADRSSRRREIRRSERKAARRAAKRQVSRSTSRKSERKAKSSRRSNRSERKARRSRSRDRR